MKSLIPQVHAFRLALESAAPMYDLRLNAEILDCSSDYYELLIAWNPRLHLVAPCSPDEFATRHVLESFLLLPHLSRNSKIADVGSGAGLPIIPCLIARPDLRAILIESSKKKCVFLRECLNQVKTRGAGTVLAERFEKVATPEVDVVTCRALDRFSDMFPRLLDWSPQRSTLMLFGGEQLGKKIERTRKDYSSIQIPGSKKRFLFIVKRA
jgi:16S rRNA (guanine527-N7)-methyltransferase